MRPPVAGHELAFFSCKLSRRKADRRYNQSGLGVSMCVAVATAERERAMKEGLSLVLFCAGGRGVGNDRRNDLSTSCPRQVDGARDYRRRRPVGRWFHRSVCPSCLPSPRCANAWAWRRTGRRKPSFSGRRTAIESQPRTISLRHSFLAGSPAEQLAAATGRVPSAVASRPPAIQTRPRRFVTALFPFAPSYLSLSLLRSPPHTVYFAFLQSTIVSSSIDWRSRIYACINLEH